MPNHKEGVRKIRIWVVTGERKFVPKWDIFLTKNEALLDKKKNGGYKVVRAEIYYKLTNN